MPVTGSGGAVFRNKQLVLVTARIRTAANEPRCCYTAFATWRFSWNGSGWDHTRVS